MYLCQYTDRNQAVGIEVAHMDPVATTPTKPEGPVKFPLTAVNVAAPTVQNTIGCIRNNAKEMVPVA